MAFDPLSFIIGPQTGKGSGGGSGGDYSDIHFVTFMSEDGTTELYKRAVVDGDDCADPVKRGYISEPPKESTAQYNYTLVGWSASPNGALDKNILKAITADKTVYANFAAVLRYYTVTYYDDDGTTVLKTESLAYGATPSYKPTKDGFAFVEWTPKEAVSGEMSYTAVWKVKAAFETATWAEIAAICEAGTEAEYFALGDTREITLTDGKKFILEIIGINHDDLSDGSGKATLTLCVKDGDVEEYYYSFTKGSTTWANGGLRTKVLSYYALLPSDLKPLIQTVTKKTMCRMKSGDYSSVLSQETLFALSKGEAFENTGYLTDGPRYSYLKTAQNRIRYKNGEAVSYFVRTTTTFNDYSKSISKTGLEAETTSGSRTDNVIFAFCIGKKGA